MINHHNKYYYKIRIIVTFAMISILLVLGMSRASYFFVKNLYLQQLDDQLNIASNFITDNLDAGMISLLELGKPSGSVEDYFSFRLSTPPIRNLKSDIFIFNTDLDIVFIPGNNFDTNQFPEIVFYETELSLLGNSQGLVTTPFEGIDKKWYLYSFRRISPNLFLGIKAHAAKFSKIEDFDNLFWWLGLAGIIIIVVISWLLANSITRPIYKLVNFSQAIGDNKLETIEPENLKGELSILGKAMDTMRKNILRHQQERENMLAQIAHEIRNPLGGIELLAGLTKEDLVKNNMNDEYQQKILDEVSGLKRLITSYLNYSKPAPANPEDVDIKELVDDIERAFQIKLQNKTITLNKNITTSWIRFDRDQLKHTLMNLVANSIEIMNNSGNIVLKSFSKNGNTIIAVEDDGPGIDNENIGKVFEPFFTTKKDGIGLGLAISKKYCLENNADLSVENNLNKGVTFKIIKEV